MHKIHYICHYQDVTGTRDLVTQPSGITKINYVKSTLKKAGFYVSVFSVSQATEEKNVNYYPITKIVDSNESIAYIHSFGRTNIILKATSRLWMQIQLLLYLFFRIRSNDKILIYHSLVLIWPIKIFRLLTKKKIFIEVEELFSAALQFDANKIESEKKYLRNTANGYILVNDIIGKKCNFLKPSVVCYGDYEKRSLPKERLNDSKIHIVYAGVIDKEGTDAFVAAETAKYLPNNYRMHILGYGANENIFKLKEFVANLNRSLGYGAVTYDGCLSGEEYRIFLSKCNIGLCTRVLADDLSDYTFPSKILVYLGHGLIPICSPISSVIESQVNDSIVFTKEVTPRSVAEAILSVNIHSSNLKLPNLDELDTQFLKSIKHLFSTKE